MTVRFSKPKVFQATVSRMVAYTFVNNPKPETNNTVNHIDEDKHNNYYKNLEWVTQKENIQKQSKDTTHKKRVVQLDENGKVLKVFDTVVQAAESVNLERTSISKVLVGKNKTAGGYRWSYEEEEKRPENREVVDTKNSDIMKCLTCFASHLTDYYAFRDGRIYNEARKTFLKPCVNDKGANYVTLPKEETGKKNVYVQQLIATAFIPNPENKKYVRHIDGNKSNNNAENLKWF